MAGAWRVSGGGELLRLLADQGRIYIQDEASQLAAQSCGSAVGDRVLDVCAAPGSKSSQIAALGDIHVIAGDVHEHRIRTVLQSSRTQRLTNLDCLFLTVRWDCRFRMRTFERVLVDAPCSGTGTLRHNPEIRWRISAEDLQDLSARQRQLLCNAARVVKPGGRLVYSTCSLEPEENEEVVAAFLEMTDQFEPASVEVKRSSGRRQELPEPGLIVTIPKGFLLPHLAANFNARFGLGCLRLMVADVRLRRLVEPQ